VSTVVAAPPAETVPRARTGLLIVLAGGAVGAFSVGVLARLAMFVLIEVNPESEGVISDDGFEMGRFTASGSLNLAAAGVGLGLLSGLVYLALERLQVGPAWFRTLALSVGGGIVVGSQLVHPEGVDFALLEPLVLPVALFLAIPVLHIAVLDVWAVRIRGARGGPVPSATGVIAWILRAGLAALVVVAVASLVGDVRDLSG
jgi:hypothetical protein